VFAGHRAGPGFRSVLPTDPPRLLAHSRHDPLPANSVTSFPGHVRDPLLRASGDQQCVREPYGTARPSASSHPMVLPSGCAPRDRSGCWPFCSAAWTRRSTRHPSAPGISAHASDRDRPPLRREPLHQVLGAELGHAGRSAGPAVARDGCQRRHVGTSAPTARTFECAGSASPGIVRPCAPRAAAGDGNVRVAELPHLPITQSIVPVLVESTHLIPRQAPIVLRRRPWDPVDRDRSAPHVRRAARSGCRAGLARYRRGSRASYPQTGSADEADQANGPERASHPEILS
jgi:hypothetical protein